jgi:hypothetical protein
MRLSGPAPWRGQKTGMGILALKAMAHQSWPETISEYKRKGQKAFYEPFDWHARGLRSSSRSRVLPEGLA